MMNENENNLKKRKFSARFFMILSILLVLCLAAVLLLPPMVEFAVNQILKRSAVRGYIVCDISQITPFSANASVNARQKMPNGRFRQVLSLPHCRISYTPLSLLHGRIDGITITGATIPVSFENGRIILPIAEIFESVQQEKEELEKAASPTKVPDLGFIRIENGALNLRFGGKTLYVPVSMTIRQEGYGWKKLIVKGRIHLNGQTIVIREAAVDTVQKEIKLSLRVRDAMLNNLPHPLDLYVNEVGLQGNMNADILADFNYGKRVVHHIGSRLKIQNFSALAGGQRIFSKLLTYNLDFDGKRGSLVLENLDFVSLFHLDRSATEFECAGDTISGRTSLEVKMPEKSVFDFGFSVSADPAGKRAKLSVRSLPGKKYAAVFGGVKGSLDSLGLQLNLSLEKQAADLILKGAGIDYSGKKAFVKNLSLHAQHENSVFSGRLSGNISKAEDSASSLSAEGIVFDLPFLRGGSAEGTVAVGSLSYKKDVLGKVEAKTKISLNETLLKDCADISGVMTVQDYPDIKIRFRSENNFNNGVFLSRNSFTLPETRIPDIKFYKIAKELSGLKLTGNMKASGAYSIGTLRGGSGYFKASVSGAKLTDASHELTMDGIGLNFELPSLPALRSSPGMKITVDQIRFGRIGIKDFSMIYRMESPTVWTVEAIKADWASGVVRMEFTRLDLTKKFYELVLHCDRLNLSEILAQLGQGTAAGEGTLNGTLPVTISPGNIVFHDGFLNSTPGVTGSLKLSNTEYLTAGVPKNIPQYTQLKFSQDVLKDFSYDWAKLNVSSKNDVLTLQMKISGKPSRPLPYRYDGGELVQINALTNFEGVRLDVNFNLPLANILNIINNIKKLSGGSL